jgi:ankyrin repeat protein
VNREDNLGNTALHRIAGVPTALAFLDCLEIIIKAGGDINARNVFEETPASVLFLDVVFDVFIKHRMNFNAQDRWGRSPLASIMRHRPHPDLLRRLLTNGKANVNSTDMFGSTPLHIAAYHNFEEQVELLLTFGANKESKDDLQDRPVDTARRHRSSRCRKILVDGGEIRTKPPSFDEILLGIPEEVLATDLTSVRNVQAAVPLPGNLNDFYEYLLSKYYHRSPENAKELENILSAVQNLVKSLCDAVFTYDSRFKMTIFPTGSSAEDTKVGKPDEFDLFSVSIVWKL